MQLREARERKKLTQEQLSEKSGVSQSQISRLECEYRVNPGFSIVRKLEAALGLKPGTLTFGDIAEAS